MTPEIGQLVYVVDKNIFVRVIDKKSIDGIMIYYTDDSLAYVIEQLHYLPKQEQEQESDELKEILMSVLSEWSTPDDNLISNVKISKAIAKPLGYELIRKLKKKREIKNYFDSYKGEKILFIKGNNFSYYWRLILTITTTIYFLFSICYIIFYDFKPNEINPLLILFGIFSVFYGNFFFDDFKYYNSCYLIIGEEIGSDKDWFGWNIENKNSDRLGYLTKEVIRKIGIDSDGQILILTHKKFHLDLNNREIKVTDKFADKKDDVITFLKMNFDSQSK
jgi:hypothetical protein